MCRCSDDVIRLGTSKECSLQEAGTAEWGRKAKALPSVFHWLLMLTFINTVVLETLLLNEYEIQMCVEWQYHSFDHVSVT